MTRESKQAARKLAWSSLRFRAAASIAVFLAVLLGCSILVACGGLFESAIRLDTTPQRLAAAPIVVAGSAGFKLPSEESQVVPYTEKSHVDADLVTKITAIPGVARALTDESFPAVVIRSSQPIDSDGAELFGHDWTSAGLTPYTLRNGNAPVDSGQVVLDTKTADSIGAQPGSKIDIAVNGQSQAFTVTGIAQAEYPVSVPSLFFSTVDVQRFYPHPTMVDAIGVFPDQGITAQQLAKQLNQQLPQGLSILTGDGRGSAEFTGIAASQLPLIVLSSVFGAMTMLVIALVVSATISLSVRQRQQEIALLRASGATPNQVHHMVVTETMVVSALAVIGGVPFGWLMGRWIFSLSVEHGVVPAALNFQQDIIPFGVGAILASLTPWISARFAARAAAQTRPIQALAEASIPPVAVSSTRRLLAVIFAVGAVISAGAAMFLPPDIGASASGPAMLAGVAAIGLLGPEIIARLVLIFTGAVHRIVGSNGRLAVINVRSRAVQFSAVLVPVILATSLILGNFYSVSTQNAAAIQTQLGQFKADAVLTSNSGGIAPELAARVQKMPGVAGVSELVSSQGWLEKPYQSAPGEDYWELLGIDAQDKASTFVVPVVSGSLNDLRNNTVALPEKQAERMQVNVGDQIVMRLGDGAQVNVKVVALLSSPANYERLVLPVALLAKHTSAGLSTQILVRGEPEKNDLDLVNEIRQQTQAWPGISVGDQSLLVSNFSTGLGLQAWINYLLAGLAAAYAAIACVNTLAVTVLSRRREFAVQRLTGATRRQVMRMLYVEGAIIAVLSLILGAGVASVFNVIPTAISSGAILPSGPAWIFLATIVLVFAIVWPVTLITGRLAMKRKALDAISSLNG